MIPMIHNIRHMPHVIPIGIQTETGVEAIGFDVKPWLDEYDGLTITVWPTRPGEGAAYPAADVKLVGTVLYWTPNATDTAIQGVGRVEILGVADGKRKLSGYCDTLVKGTSLDATQETPEPIKPWVDQVVMAGAQAEAAVEKMPSIGENGNWYAWDAAAGAYVDTGKPSKGKDGQDGEDGYTPVKGKDYFDGEDGYTPVKGKDYFDGNPGYTPVKGKDYFDGEDGISPVVEVTPITGGHRVTITDANGRKSFDVMNGEGSGGSGNDGEDGGYYIPDVVNAILSWTPSKSDMPAVPSADIKGPKGDAGYTPVKGKDYFDGANGTSVTVKRVSTSSADGGSNVVTFSDGKTLTVKNGSKGNTGDQGTPGYTPVKGTDYWTAADRQSIVNDVVAALPKYNGEAVSV